MELQVLVEFALGLEALGAREERAAQLDYALHRLELLGLSIGCQCLTLTSLPTVYEEHLR